MLNKRVPPAQAVALAAQAKARGRQEERKQRLARVPSTQDALLRGALVGIALVAIAVVVIAVVELRGRGRSPAIASPNAAPITAGPTTAVVEPSAALDPPGTRGAAGSSSSAISEPRPSQVPQRSTGPKQAMTTPALPASAPAPAPSQSLPVGPARPASSGLEMPFHRNEP